MLIRAEMYHKANKRNESESEKPTTVVISPTHPECENMKGVLGENSALLPTSDGRCGNGKGQSFPWGQGVAPCKH